MTVIESPPIYTDEEIANFVKHARGWNFSIIDVDERRITDAQLQYLLDKGFSVYNVVRFKNSLLNKKYYEDDE